MPLNERKANISVPEGELARQREYAEAVRSIIEAKYSEPPKAFVHTYGCQGNVADGERLKGMLASTPAPSVSTPRTESSAMSGRSRA